MGWTGITQAIIKGYCSEESQRSRFCETDERELFSVYIMTKNRLLTRVAIEM